MQRSFVFALALVIASALGCTEEPEFVYVLEAPQSVSLVAYASAARVFAGEPIVLHVQRRTSGVWKRIPMKSRAPDQCWMRRPPPESENEVADNVRWTVNPEGIARFNIDFRSDHTRQVWFSQAGKFTLTPSTAVWCERRSIAGPAVEIEVATR